MKHGHCTGRKRERPSAAEWYRTIEEENIQRIEEEWGEQDQSHRAEETAMP